MGTYASLVVTTMPKRHGVSALWRAARAAADIRDRDGVDHCRAVQGARFRADVLPPFTPGRVGVMTWACSLATLVACDRDLRSRLDAYARETWQVLLEPVSVEGDWFGYVPEVTGAAPLRLAEPAVVLINGVLRARHAIRFTRDNARVASQLQDAPGYLGGLGISDTPMTTTSLSCCRTRRDSRAFAFGAGAHQHAYKIDLAQNRHSTTFFVRFRPLASSGSIDGRDPFADINLGAAVPVE